MNTFFCKYTGDGLGLLQLSDGIPLWRVCVAVAAFAENESERKNFVVTFLGLRLVGVIILQDEDYWGGGHAVPVLRGLVEVSFAEGL